MKEVTITLEEYRKLIEACEAHMTNASNIYRGDLRDIEKMNNYEKSGDQTLHRAKWRARLEGYNLVHDILVNRRKGRLHLTEADIEALERELVNKYAQCYDNYLGMKEYGAEKWELVRASQIANAFDIMRKRLFEFKKSFGL